MTRCWLAALLALAAVSYVHCTKFVAVLEEGEQNSGGAVDKKRYFIPDGYHTAFLDEAYIRIKCNGQYVKPKFLKVGVEDVGVLPTFEVRGDFEQLVIERSSPQGRANVTVEITAQECGEPTPPPLNTEG